MTAPSSPSRNCDATPASWEGVPALNWQGRWKACFGEKGMRTYIADSNGRTLFYTSKDDADWIADSHNALLDKIAALTPSETAASKQPESFVNMRISYRGFSYGMGSEDGIRSLRRAIEEKGDQ